MPRPPSKHPTDGELEILQILWDQQPVALSDICTALRAARGESNAPATTTVATMLRVMHDKGLVSREGAGRNSRWRAVASRRDTADSLVGKLVDGLFAGSAEQLVAHLVESKSLTNTELAELRTLLATTAAGDKSTRRAKS
jgi:predicted transcriptional regulator